MDVSAKYLFWNPKPINTPKDLLNKIIYRIGYVSLDEVKKRDRETMLKLNNHIRDTLVNDRLVIAKRWEKLMT